MKPHYFPPGEDLILHNEAPTDFYILVTGAVPSGIGFLVHDLISHRNGIEQVLRELKTGDVFGEIGVLCYKPQLFTVRTKQLSQLLRLNSTSFLNIVRTNDGDGDNNHEQSSSVDAAFERVPSPEVQAISTDTELMLAQGRMDLPLSLCFAAERGDNVLLYQLLKRGLDSNDLNKNAHTAMPSKGKLERELLLLDSGADPNCKDSEGNVPLWDAILGNHEAVKKLLVDNGATLFSADVGKYACFAAEEGNIDLLKEIIRYVGDVTLLSNMGTTAVHTAISDENVEIVKFLLEQGADINKPDVYGWTPRALADYRDHEEIKALITTKPESNKQKTPHENRSRRSDMQNAPHLRRYSNKATMPPSTSGDTSTYGGESILSNNGLRRRASKYQNSLFRIISAACEPNEGGMGLFAPPIDHASRQNRARVVVSCPETGNLAGKMVILPGSFQELLDLGYQCWIK